MYFKNWAELQENNPVSEGVWNRSLVYEYLVWHCDLNFTRQIDAFFQRYSSDETLAGLLFSFLLNEDYDGSDCQMGAARILTQMDRDVLRKKKELLLKAQENPVFWKRPFSGIPPWLND